MNDFDLLSGLKKAMHPLSADGSGGSHTVVYSVDPEEAALALGEMAQDNGGAVREAQELGRNLGRRFLIKVGNIDQYVVKLKNGRQSVISRQIPSEAFGPSGYNLAPTIDKVHTDAREAVREIPYFGFGGPDDLFAPDVLGQAVKVVGGRDVQNGPAPIGTFLVEDQPDGRIHRDSMDILASDPYFSRKLSDIESLIRFQTYLREHPLDTAMEERLRQFFDAPITVGVRDTLRFLEGSRHPSMGWAVARDIIDRCFADHGRENFLPPEINYYTHSLALDEKTLREWGETNDRVARAFARWMVKTLPFAWTASVDDEDLFAVARGLLSAHFNYPVFEVEPNTGILSAATLRLALRVAMGAVVHVSGISIPERRNPITGKLVEQVRPVASFLEKLNGGQRSGFFNIVNALLWEVAVRGGIPGEDGRPLPYRSIRKTFYSFQERAQRALGNRGVVEEVLTLEELFSPSGQRVLQKHPELARKLTVFFVLSYRYFLDTGHAPDLRPDDVGMDLFVRGIWGYKTQNVLVVTGRSADGRPIEAVRFVDNKDQFKQYRSWEDRERPLGLVKYGIRLIHPVVEPGLVRSIGIYVDKVASSEGIKKEHGDTATVLARSAREVLLKGVDSTITSMQAVLHDAIDDTADAVEISIKKTKRSDL